MRVVSSAALRRTDVPFSHRSDATHPSRDEAVLGLPRHRKAVPPEIGKDVSFSKRNFLNNIAPKLP
jgi:hypothetical protein